MRISCFTILFLFPFLLFGQSKNDNLIQDNFKNVLLQHKEFVSIPNLPENVDLMLKNMNWVKKKYDALGFKTSLLESIILVIKPFYFIFILMDNP